MWGQRPLCHSVLQRILHGGQPGKGMGIVISASWDWHKLGFILGPLLPTRTPPLVELLGV